MDVELEENYSRMHELLKHDTDLTENLVSTWTNKKFRGQVTERDFKLISSEFIGNFDNNHGTIEIRIHKVFQVLFGIMLTYPLIAFGLILFGRGIYNAVQFTPLLVFAFLFIRYVFIGVSFKLISRTGLKKLTQTLNIKNVKEEAHFL